MTSNPSVKRFLQPLAGCASLILAAILASTPLWAQEDSEPEPPLVTTLAVVPVVAEVVGVGDVLWRSEIFLRNSGADDLEVVLSMPGTPGEPFFFTTVSSGDFLALNALLSEVFGVGQAIAPLLVQTIGPRPITVISAIRGFKSDGLTRPQVIPVFYSSRAGTSAMLPGLSITEQRRTNLGLVNYGPNPATFTVGIQVVPGRNIDSTLVYVPPYSVTQRALQEFFPILTEGENLVVIAETFAPDTFAYASVIDNETNEPRLVLSR